MIDFKKLRVYEKAFELSLEIYHLMKESDNLRLKSQLFGSTTSVCANLAEFASYDTTAQKKHKIKVCIGETNETEFWLDFCKAAGLLNIPDYCKLLNSNTEIRKMLFCFLNQVSSRA